MELKNEFLTREFTALRSEIEKGLKETRDLQRYAAATITPVGQPPNTIWDLSAGVFVPPLRTSPC